MYQEKISFEKALELENQGQITIYNPNNVESIFSTVKEWKDNWDKLRKTFRKVPIHKLTSFANFEYLIEYKFIEEGDPIKINWVYMYGQDESTRIKLNESTSKGQYVYILTNKCYPGICKIGKAVTPSKRVKQINGAGTVCEWELKYALPVTDDYKVETEVHKELSYIRMSSLEGSSREFFQIEFDEAVKVIERIGENFATAKPIYY